ncbi:hypothetical protein EAO71_36155 [Streptomyces sp. ms191]|uniref:hypothetical protein n=1 Tax=Streptomyces sp. ms191 TaxID=1827978 RepID=UPI0011CDE409|nr:hypothetical protein [Streptomyces sp. ms191]TXS12869.1 hypothetical protein EAO71_36155 [Streptomyces sp. ms191]
MSRLPRILADLLAFWRDIARYPREVLLNRAHHQWRAAGMVSLIAALVALDVPGFSPNSFTPAFIICGPSLLLDCAGTLAHGLWKSGRIWPGVECQCCGDDPDDGDDQPQEDAPDGGSGLARDVETWLRTQTTRTH